MISPSVRHYNHPRKTSSLHFADYETLECHMRGGICWPMPFESKGRIDVTGYALMCGLDVATGDVYVFEQTPWVVIDNILSPNGKIKYLGLSHWLNSVWTKYFADSYYYHQDYESSKRFILAVTRSKMIQPKPRFLDLPPLDAQDMIATIWRYLKAGQLKRQKGTELEARIESIKANDKVLPPEVHALGCALCGIDRNPWRAPVEKPVREILIPA